MKDPLHSDVILAGVAKTFGFAWYISLSKLQNLCPNLVSIGKKQGLCFSELRSLSTAATPYLLSRESNRRRKTPSSNEVEVDLNLYDPRKDERVKIPDQTLPEELCWSVRTGSSRGWVGAQNIRDSAMRLTNMFNPCASVSSRKVISLPPWDDSRGRNVCRISLSASPDQQDCVVAAKTSGSSFSMCRPGDSEWTHIRVPFFASSMTYSAADQKFYLHTRARKEEYEGPIDLINTTSSDFPQVSLYQSFPLSDIPESRQEELISTFKTTHQVESPSGDSFLVYWCDELLNKQGMESTLSKEPPHKRSYRRKPRGFLVFRQDPEKRIASYTEDIGDLCIFLGRSEAFCVSATEYPGLNPNSVYYAGVDTGFGFYDLSSNTLHAVPESPPFPCSYMWLAPLQ
ncbi:unnamed protein product [Microthlaspi erraticum]|uniref:KIB1-4 beta-propeller domain-containing protein n=1 Tax=Microthlaspi erraticum TaxID=1685480 RepID=A0A6D2JAD8_9BRAS|nr:unnamed protein product [Microthlaspi erraticum]